MESPFVTAFVILLKILSFPIPEFASNNLHGLFDQISHAIHLQNYFMDILMDPNPPSYIGKHTHENTFDFVIVGGGTAGSLIAAKLSEKYKVLVLEAGAEPSILSTVPMFNIFQWTSNYTQWGHHSVAQKDNCYACKKRKVKYIQGKSLGGTMNLGHSIYSRGSVNDFNCWTNATNDMNWSYTNMTKYWRKIENYKGKYDDSMSHGFSGMFKINVQQYQPLVKEWLDSGNVSKIKLADYNEPNKQGFSNIETTINDGRRWTTYTSYLKKEMWRKSLKVIRYATVEKIVFAGNRAAGVIFHRAGKDVEVRVTKEVILTAGVFNTPKILLASGIGPEQHLRDLNIKMKVNLEHVGQNLQDQPCTLYGPVSVASPKSFMTRRNLTFAAIVEYNVNQSGPLTWNLMSGIGYFPTQNADEKHPNIQVTLIPFGVDTESYKIANLALGLKEDYMNNFLKEWKENDAMWCSVCLVRTKSRGSVRLRDTKWQSEPIIDPRYYENAQDMVDMVEGLQFTQKLFETKVWTSIDARLISKSFPGCEKHKGKTPLYYECLANHLTFSSGSVGGTCRMGMDASDSVVNTKLLVHNIKRLRIADASVMPLLPNGMAGTVVLALAERATDLLFEKWDSETALQRDRSTEGTP